MITVFLFFGELSLELVYSPSFGNPTQKCFWTISWMLWHFNKIRLTL